MEKIVKTSVGKNGAYTVITSERILQLHHDGVFSSTTGGEHDSHTFVGRWEGEKVYSDFFGDVTSELGLIVRMTLRSLIFQRWVEKVRESMIISS